MAYYYKESTLPMTSFNFLVFKNQITSPQNKFFLLLLYTTLGGEKNSYYF